MGRPPPELAPELRAVAPLVVTGESPHFVGTCTLVTNGVQTIALSSAELLRQAGLPLAVALTLDGNRLLPITSWSIGRSSGIGIIELGPLGDGGGTAWPKDASLDVEPLWIGSVYATVETRGAPAGLVIVTRGARGFERRVIAVQVDAVDGGGMSDEIITRLASPMDPIAVGPEIEGAPLFAWMPPDPVLGRPSEVVAVALGVVYRMRTFQPRAHPAIAELLGLEDLGRALPWEGRVPEGSNELGQVAGEIRDEPSDVLAGVIIDAED